MNVSYLAKALGPGFESLVNHYKANYVNGLLTISESTDLSGLITAIANAASEAGALIPEQLAEIADAVADMLS